MSALAMMHSLDLQVFRKWLQSSLCLTTERWHRKLVYGASTDAMLKKENRGKMQKNIEDADFAALSQHLAQAVTILGRMRARRETADVAANPDGGREFRRYLGGPLSERGEAEINRRFEAGLGDSEIAMAMGISLAGVSRRRTMWRRTQEK